MLIEAPGGRNHMTELTVDGRTSREVGETVSEEDIMLFSNAKMSFRVIIIFINCNWVVTRWQRSFCMYTKYEIGYY
jgi:hypothetical protein